MKFKWLCNRFAPMQFQNILLQKKDGVATIILNRPTVLNALDIDSRKELLQVLRDVEQDASVRVVVITGAGDKAFSTGADLRIFKDMTRAEAARYVRLAKRATRTIETLGKPVIAAVNGYALGGGCEIALACDFIIASDNAVFGQTEINVGLIPGAGGTQRLPRLIGIRKAKELILAGTTITAEEALRLGLANLVVSKDKLMDAVYDWARRLSEKSPVILRLAKAAINRAIEKGLHNGLQYESRLFAACFVTQDQKEGVKAFLEKRKPTFIGK